MFKSFLKKPYIKIFVLLSIFSLIIFFEILKSNHIKSIKKSPNFAKKDNNQNVLGTNEAGKNQNPPPGFKKLLTTPTPTPKITPTPIPSSTPKPTSTQSDNTTTSQPITASKANFNPNFSISLENSQNSVASTVNLEVGSSSGNWQGIDLKTLIPSGWNIIESKNLPQDETVGQGTIQAQLNAGQSSTEFTLYNQKDSQNHKGRWLAKFSNSQYTEKTIFVDGDKSSGYSLALDGPIGIALASPAAIKITILSKVMTNPSTAGVFEWKEQYIFPDGILEIKKSVEIK